MELEKLPPYEKGYGYRPSGKYGFFPHEDGEERGYYACIRVRTDVLIRTPYFKEELKAEYYAMRLAEANGLKPPTRANFHKGKWNNRDANS